MADAKSPDDPTTVPGAAVPDQRDDPDSSADYAGAIYGSLLAASTIIGTAAAGPTGPFLRQLLVALVGTSVVFWLLHVYVHVVGRELPRNVPWRRATRLAARHELPILVAVVPPAAVILIAMGFDEPSARVGWWALWVAIAGQVFWTWVAVRRAHVRGRVAILSLAVSLALGLVLVLLKAGLSH